MAGSLLKRFKKNSSTQEIMQLVEQDQQSGLLELSQREMINNIFLFDDITAGDIMTHRTDIEAVEDTASVSDVVDTAIKEGFSRIPVYKDDLDNITGIVYVKDLLKFIGAEIGSDENLKDYVRTPLFVPETISCIKLFKQMKDKRVQLAIVVDEYGGTAGLVSMEDILESIVGNIQDEYDEDATYIRESGTDHYVIEGMMPLEELEEKLRITFEDEPFDTVNGFVISRLEHIPEEGEDFEFSYGGYLFRILEVKDRMIRSVSAVREKQTEEGDTASDEEGEKSSEQKSADGKASVENEEAGKTKKR